MSISFDTASNSGYQAASSSYSWSHTCGGSYRCLVVAVAMLNIANEVSTLTYNSVALTKLRSDVDGTGTVRTDIYYLINPTIGSNTIAVTLNSASVSGTGASSYAGVDPDNPVDAQAGTTGTTGAGGGSSSLAITTVSTGAYIVDALATTDTSITAAAGQTERNNVTGAVGSGGQSEKALLFAPGATTVAWDNIGALLNWTASAIALKPFVMGTTTSTTSVSTSSTSSSSTSSSISSTSSSTSSTSKSISTSSTSYSMSITTVSTSSTSSSTSSTSFSSTSSSTSISSTSSSISSTSYSSTSISTTSQSTSISSTSSSISSTSSSISSTSMSTSSTSFSSTSSSSSTSSTTVISGITYSYEDRASFTQTQTFNITGAWVCPANVTAVKVECWGGGGGGGVNGSGGGGGGGGAYSKLNALSVTAGTSYTVTVGSGGAAQTAGGDSWFSTSGTVLAKGGAGGDSTTTGGAGGVAGSGIGDVTKSGGTGGNGGAGGGGGGGGAAGDTSPGGTGGNDGGLGGTAGAMGATTGGTGAVGPGSGSAGNPGKAIGGGGSGGGGGNAGGTGASGNVWLTYATTVPPPSASTNLINTFTNLMYSNVSGDDGDYFIEFGSEDTMTQFRYRNPRNNNTDNIMITLKLRSTQATTISPIILQIFNQNSSAWETIAAETRIAADVDFVLRGYQTANLSNYYDSTNTVYARVYQLVV